MKAACDEIIATAVRRDIGSVSKVRARNLETALALVMGLSPGTVATQMQREIKSSGINPISKLEWEDHIPADWPARALLWMCSPEADDFIGTEISLRDDAVRKRVGLV